MAADAFGASPSWINVPWEHPVLLRARIVVKGRNHVVGCLLVGCSVGGGGEKFVLFVTAPHKTEGALKAPSFFRFGALAPFFSHMRTAKVKGEGEEKRRTTPLTLTNWRFEGREGRGGKGGKEERFLSVYM